jgi:hypothetical protein
MHWLAIEHRRREMTHDNPKEDMVFLITASELRDRKARRRRKHDLPGHPAIQAIELGLGAAPVSSLTERLKAARASVSAAAGPKAKGK